MEKLIDFFKRVKDDKKRVISAETGKPFFGEVYIKFKDGLVISQEVSRETFKT